MQRKLCGFGTGHRSLVGDGFKALRGSFWLVAYSMASVVTSAGKDPFFVVKTTKSWDAALRSDSQPC